MLTDLLQSMRAKIEAGEIACLAGANNPYAGANAQCQMANGKVVGDELAYRPTPSGDGSLLQDPDWELPTTAGPVKWALYHDSTKAAELGPYGYGRLDSFNLKLVTDASNVVTVSYENGTRHAFQGGVLTGTYVPLGQNFDYLQKNGDNTWSLTHWESGYQYGFPAGNVVSVAYRETPQGRRVSYNYDGEQRLSSLVEPAGRRVTLGYAESGRTTISYVQDWGDRRNTLVYSAAGDLIENIGPTGCLTQYEYDGSHRLSEIVDPEGYATSYTYDYAGRVLSRSVAGNLGLYTYQVDANGTVTMVFQDALNRIWTQCSDQWDNLLRTQDPLGNRTTASFVNYRPFNATDATGNLTSFAFDGNGFLRQTKDAGGNRTTLTRDLYGNVTAQIDPLNRRTTISFGANPEFRQPVTVMNALGQISTMGYTSWGARESVTDPMGFVNTWLWDSFGNLQATIDPLGRRVSFEYDAVSNQLVRIDMLGYRWSMYYDAMGRTIASENPLGYRHSTLYDARGLAQATIDPSGARTSYQWNAYGSRTEVQNPLGYRTTWQYNAANELVATIDALGNRKTTVYDLAGRPEASVSPLGYRNTTVYDGAGRAIASVDALGYRSTTVYDVDGRPEVSINARGFRTTTVYDAAGQAVAQQDAMRYLWTTVYDALGRAEAQIDPLGRRTSTVYDARGMVAAQIDQLGRRTSFAYDAAGQQIGVQTARSFRSTTLYDVLGRVEASQSALDYRTSFSYDAAGQQVERQDALGNRWSSVYDANGRVFANVDPLNNRSTTSFDAAGQSIGTVDALGNRNTTVYDAVGRVAAQQNGRGYVTSFVYDASGQQTAIQDARGNRNTTLYDARGLVSAEIDPLDNRQTYGYDSVGNRTLRTDGRGYVTTSVYDGVDRETRRQYPDGTRVTWFYDADGRLDRTDDWTGTLDNLYYATGLMQRQTQPGDLRLSYSYDTNNNRFLLVGPNGARVTYGYDAQDRVTSIENQWGERTTIAWDALDREQRRVFANGMSTSHVYDAAGRETGLRTCDSAGNDLQRYTATYDAVGNRLTSKELDGTLVTYGYDTAYQLTLEQRSGTYAYDKFYEYDPVGNRQRNGDNVAGTVVTSTYNAANELTTQEEKDGARTTFAYDRNGNTLSEDRLGEITQYAYDYENRLIGQVDPDGSRYTYTYREDSRRVKNETPDGLVRNLLWDELNCLQELDGGYSLIAQYTDYPGQWGGLASQRRGADSSYYGFDLQWTGRVLVAQSQLISDTYTNDAWGVELASSGAITNPCRYVGRYGYAWLNTRMIMVWDHPYSADLGRWISRDKDTSNPISAYLYVHNRPLMFPDPTGLVVSVVRDHCPSPCNRRSSNGNAVQHPDDPRLNCGKVRAQYRQILDICAGYGQHMQAGTDCCWREVCRDSPCLSSEDFVRYDPYSHTYSCLQYTGCITIQNSFDQLPTAWQWCLWQHERRRVKRCVCMKADGLYYLHRNDVTQSEEDRMNACAASVLSACNLNPGDCTPKNPVPPFDPKAPGCGW